MYFMFAFLCLSLCFPACSFLAANFDGLRPLLVLVASHYHLCSLANTLRSSFVCSFLFKLRQLRMTIKTYNLQLAYSLQRDGHTTTKILTSDNSTHSSAYLHLIWTVQRCKMHNFLNISTIYRTCKVAPA